MLITDKTNLKCFLSLLKLFFYSLRLDIQVMMYETVPLGSSHEAGYMAIEAKGENHILHKIWCMTDGKIKVNWKMSDFGVMNDQGIVETDNSTCWESEGIFFLFFL